MNNVVIMSCDYIRNWSLQMGSSVNMEYMMLHPLDRGKIDRITELNRYLKDWAEEILKAVPSFGKWLRRERMRQEINR